MPLSHVRVVEIGSSAAAAYCARLFADFGASVKKIEQPAGDPLRQAGPLTSSGNSAWFAFLNFNKSSVVIDGNREGATEQLEALIVAADILIDGRAIDTAGCPDIDIDRIKRSNPGLVNIDISWFGGDGPYAQFKATDSTIRALAGLTKLVGPVEGPPLSSPDFQAGILAGLWGFIAAASSLLGRMQDGKGRSQSLSIFESCMTVTEYIMAESHDQGDVMRRIGVNRFWPTFPVGIYATKDGWLGITTVTPAQWRSFCDMLGLADLRDDPTLFMGVDRLKRIDEIERRFIPKLRERSTKEWFAEGLKRKIPIVPVPDMNELMADAEKRERGAVVPISVGNESALSPGSMQRLTGTPPKPGGRVPAIGETQAFERELSWLPRGRAESAGNQSVQSLPLAGIRVVDFSMGWAGPFCTRTLADLGADVIKIEAIQYPDWWRGVDRRPAYVIEQKYEKVSRFCMMNRNKRGITIDLTRPEGLALAKRLVADADIVVDNYSVEVLPKLGLGYDVLSKLNPKLVMMSMSGFGAGSTYRSCRAYGSTLEQGSGLPSVIGEENGPPTMIHTAFGDPIGGLNGCAAVLTAIINARLTGQGQFIDLAQIECVMPFTAPWMIAAAAGMHPKRYGNRHPDFVPHSTFPCKGDDGWVVVAVSSDVMWPKLCRLIGRCEWASDSSMASAAHRRLRESEIEAAIAQWTSLRTPDEAMAELQAAGVAAGVARLPIEMLKDPQLRARGFVQKVDRAFIGDHPQLSMPFHEASEQYGIRRVAPTLGEHNREVLGGLIGLSDAEMVSLARDGIIGTKILMETEPVKRPRENAG